MKYHPTPNGQADERETNVSLAKQRLLCKNSSTLAKTTTSATNLRLLRGKRCCNKALTCFSSFEIFHLVGTRLDRRRKRASKAKSSSYVDLDLLQEINLKEPLHKTVTRGGWVGGEENVIMGEFSARPVKTEVVEAVAPIWEAILGSDIVPLCRTCLGVPGIKPTHCILSTSNIAPHPLSSVSTHPGRAYL